MLTLLTATGERQQAWDLCQHWMLRQDYTGEVRWIIVDDGQTPQITTFQRSGWYLEFVRPEPHWQPGMNTQSRNLRAGLARVKTTDRLVVIEDDDFAAPDWLTTVSNALLRAELVGETRARYYNIAQRRARQLGNTKHASLCATAMRGAAIDTFRRVLSMSNKFIDIDLWATAKNRMLFEGHRVVGIKGMPGRAGIGMGHRPDFQGDRDPDGEILRSWVGDEAAAMLLA